MSATIIGRVVHIKGAVEVRDLQGVIKLLSLGDDVHEGDLVQTGANAEVIIDFLNGKRLELAESSEALLDESVHRGQEFGNSELFADIEAVQKALLDGTLDINDLPATAAGPEEGGIALGDGLSEAIVSTREAREGSVDVRLSGIEFNDEAGAALVDLNPVSGPESPSPTAPESSAARLSPSVFAIADTGALSEDGATLTLSANLLGNDALASGTPLSVVAVNGSPAAVGTVVTGAFGTFTIAEDGSYTYALNNAHASVQGLADGERLTDTASYSARNNAGSTDTANITITIHGAEDAPTLTGTSSGNIGEDAIANVSGTLIANDIDAVDTPIIIAQPGTVGSYGTFTVNAAGLWTYTVNNVAAQSLGATDNVTETFTVTASTADGEITTMTITVNVAGSDDLPVISTGGGAVTENVAPSANGILTAVDADNPTLEFVADTVAGTYGDLVVLADGSWAYLLNSNAETLVSGQVENETLTVALTDGSTTTIAITVSGTDDVPVAQVHTDSAVEDGAVIAGNVPAATDLDGDVDINGYALVTNVGEGTLVFNADGSYTFDVGSAFQDLDATESRDVTFTYTATDDQGNTSLPATVTITVTGTDDTPIAQIHSDSAIEDGAVVAGSVPAATDLDGDVDANGYALVTTVSEGTLVFNADGSYTFDVGSSFQDLDATESRDVTFTYTATDDQGNTSLPATVTITVTGTDDTPIAQVHSDSAVEDGAIVVGNVPVATDLDGDVDANGYALVTMVGEGTLVFNADGSYTFDVGGDFQDLNAGDSRDVTFTYTATDDRGNTSAPATVTITVNGADEGAPVAQVHADSATEDGAVIAGSVPSAIDLDGDLDASGYVLVSSVGEGTLVFNADGSYTFDVGSAFQDLDATESRDVTFTYTASDIAGNVSAPATVTITITGTDDTPTAQVHSDSAVEDGTVIAGNVPAATDLDGDVDANGYALVTTVGEGTLVFNADGSYTFDVGSAFQDLDATESRDVTFTYTATDDQGNTSLPATVTITVTGTDDAPIAQVHSDSAVEDGAILVGNVPAATDLDGDVDANGYALVSTVGEGTLVFNTDGTYTFGVGGAFQDLDATESRDVTFTYTATDDQGNTSLPATVTITVTGTDDTPIAQIHADSAVEDDAIVVGNVPAATDLDGDVDANGYALVTTVGEGTLVFNADGSYTFDVGTAFQDLDATESRDVTFTYTATDDQGNISLPATVTITVTGTDDTPIAQVHSDSAAEDGAVIAGNVPAATDLDGDVDANGYALVTTVGEGTLVFNADGSYTFDVGSAFQDLDATESRDVTFTYTATDDQGNTSLPATVTITVTGTDDIPVAQVHSDSAVEDGAIVVGNVPAATDLDGDIDTNGYALVTSVGEGTLVFNADGSYTFDVGSAFQDLDATESRDVTFTYTATDDQGNTSLPATVTITVTGTDDTPIAQVRSDSAIEDGAVVVGNVPAATDLDGDVDANGYALVTTVGEGTLVFNADGSYTFDVGSAFQDLDATESRDVTFTYTATDDQGNTSLPATVTITVTGTDDTPIAQIHSDSAVEDGAVIAGNVPAATDLDGDVDANGYALVTTVGEGTLVFNADGSYTFDVGSAFQDLDATESRDVTFTYTATDDQGNTSLPATVTITVTGTDDTPIAQIHSDTAVEDGAVIAGNVPAATDLDGDVDANGYALVSTVGEGILVFNADGSYTFDVGSAFQDLDATESRDVTFTYTATDDQGNTSLPATVTITVTGTDDTPIAQIHSDSAIEDGAVIAGNVPAATDLDGDVDANGYALVTTVGEGTLVFNADGSYTFDVGSAFQDLDATESRDVTFTYTATDDQGNTSLPATVTITVTGTDDTPMAQVHSDSAIEDGAVVAGNVPAATDLDGDVDANGYALVTTVGEGTLVFNADGSYTFDVGSAFQDLDATESRDVTFTYTATDDQGNTSLPATVTITVTGTDDTPIAQVHSDSAVEDGAVVVGNVPAATDLDGDVDANGYALVTSVGEGTLVFNADGSYTFDVGSAFQDLDATESRDVTFTYTATDDQGNTSLPATVTITVTGTDDTPIAQVHSDSAIEDGAVVVGNVPAATDLDGDVDANGYALVTTVGEGTLVFNADGSYTFDVGSAFQDLDATESRDVTFTYTATDDQGNTSLPATVTITVTGTDDTPIAQIHADSAVEDGAIIAGNVPAATDLDGDVDANGYALVSTVGEGTLVFNADGSYTFDVGSAFQDLDATESRDVTFTYTATDDQGNTSLPATVTITVTGTDDTPIAQVHSDSAIEDGAIVAGNVPGATDLDGDVDANGYALVTSVGEGTLVFNTDGTYTFDVGGAFQDLDATESRDVTFTYTATDDQGNTSLPATVTITVTGTDDTPIAQVHSDSAVEDGAVIAGNVPAATDLDGDVDANSYALVSTVGEGTLVFNADGSYTFDVDGDFQDLNDGDSRDVTFTYTATDDQGNVSAPAIVTITVNGVDEGAPVAQVHTDSATEDGAVIAGSVPAATDLDGDLDASGYALVSSVGEGALVFNADGSYTFDVGSAFQDLDATESRDVTFTYTASDIAGNVSAPATVTITITGTDDTPTAQVHSDSAVEDGAVIAGNVPAATDLDGDVDINGYALVTNVGEGTLVFNADGSYTFDVGSAFQDLDATESRDVTFTYTATDDQGNTSLPATVTITVTGTDDTPIAQIHADSAIEDGAVVVGSVPAATDLDGDVDANGYALVTNVSEGTLVFNADGSYTFDVGSAFQDLDVTESRDVTFTYTATDDQGNTSLPATVTITVTGTDDTPIAQIHSDSAVEDGAIIAGSVPAATDLDGDVDANGYALVTNVGEGTLVFNTDGSYTFDVGSAFQDLDATESRDVTFTYTATDDQGNTSLPATVTITVTGTDDTPIAQIHSDTAIEDGAIIGGNVPAATDLDGDVDANGYALVTTVGEGTLVFNADGSYTFDVGTAFQDLDATESRDVTFTYTATDDQGNISLPATVTITVTGTDDTPIAQIHSDTAVEDGAVIAGNVPAATDLDGDVDANGYALVTNVSEGTLVFNTDGSYTFDVGSAFQDLDATESRDVTFTYTATDDQGNTSLPATVTITVTGTDDAPIAQVHSDSAVEDGAVIAGNVPAATDLDGDVDANGYALVTTVGEGTLVFNTDGSYTFDVGSAFQDLDATESRNVTFTYTATDDQGNTSLPATVTITVTGTDDTPMAQVHSDSAVEDGAVIAGNVPAATDLDGDVDINGYALVTNVGEGTLVFNADGSYTFDVGSAFQDLDATESRDVTFTYTATDDQGNTSLPATVTITVTGTDDTPIAQIHSDSAIEDGAVVVGSVPAATDLDGDVDANGYALVTNVSEGTLVFNADGSYTFDVGSAFQDLDATESRNVTFTYTASDIAGNVSAPATVTITVTGTDDTPIAQVHSDSAIEDGAVVAGSVPAATDLDGDVDANGYALVTTVGEGTLVFNADGSYTFDVGSAFQDLDATESRDVTFTYTATDEQGNTSLPATVTITVTGTDDTPIAQIHADSAIEDGAVITGNVPAATDLDGDVDANGYALVTTVSEGTLVFNADGSYTFDVGSAFQDLGATESRDVTFTYTASDDQGNVSAPTTVTITVTGTNDVPVASAGVNAVNEDASVSGSVVATDADAGETATLIYALTGAAPIGLTFNTDGSYTFDASSYDSLANGENLVLTIPFTASDATSTSAPQDLVITITGTNDGPTLSGASTQMVYESGLLEGTSAAPTVTTISGSLNASDIDGDELTIMVNGSSVGTLDGSTSVIGTFTGDYGTLSFNGDGTWDYALSSAVNHQVDLTPFEQFTVNVNDGSLDSPDVSIRVNITDDGLVLSSSSSTFDNTTGVTHVGALPTLGADLTYTADMSANITGWDGTTTTHFDTGMTANGHELLYYVDPGDTATLIAYTDTAGNNPFDASSVTQARVFEVRAEPNSDQYTVETFGSGNGLVDHTQTMALDVWDDRTDKEVVVVYKSPTGNAVAEYDTVAEWMADLPVFDNTIMRLSATSDDGSGNAVADQVHWHEQRIAVDDHSIEGDKEQVLTFDFLSIPVASATFGMQVDSGGYRWSAYDDAGNLLGTGTDTASSVTIGGIGAIARIDLEGMDSSSEFYVDDGLSSVTRIVNEQDIGPLSFAVNVADQDGNSASTTIDITLERVAQPGSVALMEDTQRVFTAEDFGFAPTETDPLASISIQSLESVGSLQLNGVNVVMGQAVTKAQLDAGELTFDPLPDTGGTSYDSFTFTINNSYGTGSVAAAMVIDVVPIDDGPIGPVTDTDAAVNRIALNANVGDVVGLTGLAIDPDPEDTVTYSLKNDAGGRFTIDPMTGVVTVAGSLGNKVDDEEIEIEALSSDGSKTTAKFDIALVDSADDFATVHESALTDGSGRVETVFDSNEEAGQDTAAGAPSKIATGNLLSNDGVGTSITSIDGNSPSGGVISITGSHGTLVVTAATGEYTYTLTSQADNSATADDLAVMETFQYITNAGLTADLTVTIVDDTPQTGDFITKVPEGQMSEFQLVFTLDVSGSMTGAQYDGVVYLEDGSTTTRLEMAKDALKALVTEYYEQSDAVSVHLVTFSSSAQLLNGGNPYTDLASTLAAIDGMNGSGGTNYEDGLNKMQDALDANNDGTLDVTGTNLQTITYFISDGIPTSGNTTNPVGASGWGTFLAANPIDSYAVGIGSGITDFTSLNAIHNVDADNSGTVDEAVYVPNLATLEEELLSTVPSSFGGSIVLSGTIQNVIFGADGGHIESVEFMLDLDTNGTPETNVTFTYDPNTDVISSGGVFADIAGSILPLDTSNYQFVEGKLIFDFSTGNYNYYQSLTVSEGDSFTLTFVAQDGDGDATDPTTVTVQIVDGQPVANDDTDTLFPLGSELEGNVLSGIGTDGGVSNASSFTTFSGQGAGVDNTVDDATVTSIVYRGDTIDLTTPAGTPGTPVTATANAGTPDASTYEYVIDASGTLTLSNLTDSSTLSFNTQGHYLYTPSSVPSPPTAARVNEDFNNGTGNGVLLSSPDGTVVYSGNGAGVGNNRLNTGERLEIEFDSGTYQYGVQNIQINAQSLGSSYEVFNITAYHIDGHVMGRTSIAGSATHTVFSELSGIGHIEIQAGSNTSAYVRAISFDPVQLDASAIAVEPEVIGYTITDQDIDPDSDSATLTLKVISNTLVDRLGLDAFTGTAGNDFISGLGGDDVLDGGAGHDIVEGGIGDDELTGGTGDDVLVGGEGVDTLFGDEGRDNLSGGAGADELHGGDDDDELSGGEGGDDLFGDAGADVLYGNEGNDTLLGGDDNDSLYGGTGNDILTGGAGLDFLSGGSGNDILTGGSGGPGDTESDVFYWGENDRGSLSSPDQDSITDFTVGVGGDVLDLSDLLQGEESNPLTDYLSVTVGDFDTDGNIDTRISVDADGGIFFQPNLQITLEGVDLSGGGTLTDQEILNNLITDGNLDTDT